MTNNQQDWRVFTENREAVIEQLKQGHCDGILPAARGFLDGFAGFLLLAGILDCFAAFPDRRARRSIVIIFFCHTLVYRPLFQLKRLAPIERTLFRSPYILRTIGFNALQIKEGFYDTPEAERPFTAQAIADCFAKAEADDFLENQKTVLAALADYCPGEFLSGMWVMDSVHVHVPNGAHTEAHDFKACVLGVWQDSVVWPLLWAFAPESVNETKVGKKVFAAAEEALGKGTIRHLLVDRGFVDGAWITKLYERGTRVTIGVKEDMLVMEELKNLSRLPDAEWTPAEPPKIHDGPVPERAVMGFGHLEGEWDSCDAPLSGCLIRDVYPKKTTYQALVTTAPTASPTEILEDNGKRWTLEEVYMTLTLHWDFDDLAPSRLGVALAMVHFALVAFTLLGFYLQETEAADALETLNMGPPSLPLPERELAVYAGSHFTLLLASELLEIILSNIDAWQENREQLLMALRHCEGNT
jgi:hypothetical protein